MSFKTGVASSAAAVGVAARWSEAKSVKVVSVSCPTLEMIGRENEATRLTTGSSLKAHKSSMEPPPRPMITTSASDCSTKSKFLRMLGTACTPCTTVGYNTSCAIGKRRATVV